MSLETVDMAVISNSANILDRHLANKGITGIIGYGNGPYQFNPTYFHKVHVYPNLNVEIWPRADTHEFEEMASRHGSAFSDM